MADVITGNTQLSATKQDIIAALVSRELKHKAILAPTITDVSAFAASGMKSISFPKTGSLTVENRASGAAGNAQVLAFTNDTLNLDTNAYISWIVDNVDQYQSNVNVQAEFVKRAASAHARNIDDAILTQLDTYSGYTQTAGIDQTKILNARKWLIKNQASVSDLTLAVYADDEAALLAIPEFVRADAYGSSNIPSGVVGRVYGVNVIVHTKATLAKSFLFSKEAIAFGLQLAPKYDEQKAIQYGTGSMLCAIDQHYGLKALRLTEGLDSAGSALASGKSPFIAEIG
jgi:hypothetical protein